MTHFIDITVTGPIQTFTKSVKPYRLETFILLRIPKWNQCTVRISGTLGDMHNFLNQHFNQSAADMHLPAIKLFQENPVHEKNRALASFKRRLHDS